VCECKISDRPDGNYDTDAGAACLMSSCAATSGVLSCENRENQLVCVPLRTQQRLGLQYYSGPGSLCGCHAGYGGDAGKGSCTACVPGKYKSAAGDGDCTDCGAGTYGSATGQTTCTPCGVGKYGAAGATTESKCMLCPVGKFGGREGAAACAECEPGKVSDGGERPCRSVTVAGYVIKLVLSLPITQMDFTEDKQSNFRVSIAAAAGAKPADVTIDKIEAMSRRVGRRLLSESVLVYTVIKATDSKAADAIASSLTTDKINGVLQTAGLPKATIKQTPTVESTATSENITAPLIGGIVGGLVLLIVLVKGAWEFWRYLEKNKARRQYNARFDTLDTDGDGYISEAEFAQSLLEYEKKVSSIRKSEDSPSAPYKFLVEDTSGLMSKQQYEQGFEIVEAFRDFEDGTAKPLCLLLRAKYRESKSRVSCQLGDVNVNVSPVPAVSPAAPSQSPTKPSETPKFCARKISVGSSAVSAKGLRSAVGLEDNHVLANMLKDPEHTIECEILVAGDKDDIDNFYSVKDGTSGKQDDMPDHVKHSFQTGQYHGGSITESDYDAEYDKDDKGDNVGPNLRAGKKLEYFHEHETSALAGLLIWHVLVLRLYTSSSFRLFNAPLRSLLTNNGQTKSQHPLRFTVYMLTEGIKKLRAVEAQRDPVGYNTPMDLWRGMADMEVDVQGPLLSQGGTEMAVMSTTCDKEVALKYSRSQRPLVFKYKTFGLSRGVSIQFLSLYPKEVEYVYPVPFSNKSVMLPSLLDCCHCNYILTLHLYC
jgi:hypothetical protein